METAIKANKLGEDAAQINAIDLTKFILAFFVIAIHISPLGNTEGSTFIGWVDFFLRDCIARVAVPFFFIASGYFLFRKTQISNLDTSICKSYVLKIFKLYCVWSLIYFPLRLGGFFFEEKGFLYGVFDYIKDFIFSTSFSHLWYLNALIFSVLIISFLLYKKVSPKNIICASAIFYIIGLFGQSWYGVIKPLENVPAVWQTLKFAMGIIETTRDGLFDGFLFVGIGMLFAYQKIKLTRKQSGIGFALSAVILCCEAFILQYYGFSRSHDTYIFLVPTALFLFAFVKSSNVKKDRDYKKLRVMSSLIYLIHPWILRLAAVIVYLIFKKTEIFLINYIFTSAVTVLLASLCIKLSEKKKSRWLKHLY